MTVSDADEYQSIVKEFRRLTSGTWDNERCCEDTRDGAPKCCYQIADGAALTFTPREWSILKEIGVPADRLILGPLWTMVLNRDVLSPGDVLEETHTGWLADTLECASHPTRPVVMDGQVVAVVAVLDCNTFAPTTTFRSSTREARGLRDLWQRAVDLCGMKPYYVTNRLGPGLVLI